MKKFPMIYLFLLLPCLLQAQATNNTAPVRTQAPIRNQASAQTEPAQTQVQQHNTQQHTQHYVQPQVNYSVQTSGQQTYPAQTYTQQQSYSQQDVQQPSYQVESYYSPQTYSDQRSSDPYVEGQRQYQTQPFYQQPQYQETAAYEQGHPYYSEIQGQWYPQENYPQPPIYQAPQQQPAQACCPQTKPPRAVCCSPRWTGTMELRVADFIPVSSDFRNIYDSGIPFYQFEVSLSNGGPVGAWANVGYLGRSGRSRGEEDRTYLRLVPIGFGLKYTYLLPYGWQGYFGAGPTYTFLRIHDHSDFNRHIEKSCLGGMAKIGFTYEFWCSAFLDLFVDYYYTKFNFSGNRNCIRRHDFDASAVIVGAGLGWVF